MLAIAIPQGHFDVLRNRITSGCRARGPSVFGFWQINAVATGLDANFEKRPLLEKAIEKFMTVDVLFYHLMHQPLEAALPALLQKCLERDWRVVVQAGSQQRCEALDAHLWTFQDDSFLPHGTKSDGFAEQQPIYLTSEADNPNAADVRFLVDRAAPPPLAGYQRAVYMFDGNDPDALGDARQRWKDAKSEGFQVTYWQQRENGGWERKA
ncbi:DNA polymerase III subunit chi [uncultured Roseibium sp.]|uniref:DNA polymerase III subunit chi n=1 Tax=uncultured Roseibium sp. TaxID=1936171 RepID=UPI00338DE99F